MEVNHWAVWQAQRIERDLALSRAEHHARLDGLSSAGDASRRRSRAWQHARRQVEALARAIRLAASTRLARRRRLA